MTGIIVVVALQAVGQYPATTVRVCNPGKEPIAKAKVQLRDAETLTMVIDEGFTDHNGDWTTRKLDPDIEKVRVLVTVNREKLNDLVENQRFIKFPFQVFKFVLE